MTSPSTHPEIERLRERCARYRASLREVAEEWHRLSAIERPRLLAIYDRHFGDLEKERQKLALEGAEIFRRVELLSIKVARGERITPDIVQMVNLIVDKEYARLRQRMKEVFDMTAYERDKATSERGDDAEDGELVKMYRTLAKRLHPDAVGDQPELSGVWQRVQDAYRDKNIRQLQSIVDLLNADDAAAGEMEGWDLERLSCEAERLDARLRMERRKLDRLRGQEPFILAQDLENENWCTWHRRDIEQSITAKRREIEEHRMRYREMTGNDAPGSTADESTTQNGNDEQQKFERDFMEKTYFGSR